jgi:hypothetical protein
VAASPVLAGSPAEKPRLPMRVATLRPTLNPTLTLTLTLTLCLLCWRAEALPVEGGAS